WRQVREFHTEHLEIGLGIGFRRRQLRLPPFSLGGRVRDRRVLRFAPRADPLHGHGRRRVTLPGQEERVRLEGWIVASRFEDRAGLIRPEERAGGEGSERGPQKGPAREYMHGVGLRV